MITTYRFKVAKAVTLLRESAQLKQTDMSAFLRLSQSAYSRMETGTHAFNVDHLSKVAFALKTTPSRILKLAEKMS